MYSDTFTEWPEDALEKVASRFLEEMEMEEDVRVGRSLIIRIVIIVIIGVFIVVVVTIITVIVICITVVIIIILVYVVIIIIFSIIITHLLRCVVMCEHFHESLRRTLDMYEHEMKRTNYVTPISYLELILTFKSFLKGKRDIILNLKTRYEMGLGKLGVCIRSGICHVHWCYSHFFLFPPPLPLTQ